jgi:hypothetical protein
LRDDGRRGTCRIVTVVVYLGRGLCRGVRAVSSDGRAVRLEAISGNLVRHGGSC